MSRSMALEDRSLIRGKWPVIMPVILAIVIPSYLHYRSVGETGAGTTYGMVYGISAFILVLFLSLYKIRQSVYSYRIGSTQVWMQTHIYLGIMTIILIFMHSGFNFKWNYSTFLFVLFLLVVVSGVIGTLIYATIPLSIAKYGREVTTNEDMIDALQNYIIEADNSVSNTSSEFNEVYMENIRNLFRFKGTRWDYLLIEERELLANRKRMFDEFKKMVPAGEIYDLSILYTILVEKEKLAFKWTKLRMLRVWLNLHMPLSFAMITAALVHVLSIIYF